jgi:hypothetical protein
MLDLSWEVYCCSASQEISHLHEPEGSLLCSQKSTTDPEPAECNQYLTPNMLRSTLKLSSHLCLDVPSSLFPLGFLTKLCKHFSSARCFIHGYPPWFNHANNIRQKIYIMITSLWFYPPVIYYFLGQKSPQCFILKQPHKETIHNS